MNIYIYNIHKIWDYLKHHFELPKNDEKGLKMSPNLLLIQIFELPEPFGFLFFSSIACFFVWKPFKCFENVTDKKDHVGLFIFGSQSKYYYGLIIGSKLYLHIQIQISPHKKCIVTYRNYIVTIKK